MTTPPSDPPATRTETATFGGGCFWCIEGVFRELRGVTEVVSGYAGGEAPDPTYEQVCNGTTGHAEVCRIEYDPDRITFTELLEVFFTVHDPTTLNRQGADVGTQYRSIIFFHNDRQKAVVEKTIRQLDDAGAWPNPIVTLVEPAGKFYAAEDYHQDYYRRNGQQPYCVAVIRPKMEKLRQVFPEKLRQAEP